MQKFFFILFLLYCCMSATAQITVGRTPERYYTSLAALNTSEFVAVSDLAPKLNETTGLIRFRPEDKALRKALKKEALLVVHLDSLYLNLHDLSYQGFGFDNGYVQTWPLNDSTLLFFAPDTGWKAFGKQLGVGLGTAVLTMGLTGGMAYGYPIINNWACFIYRGDGHKIKRVDRELATELIEQGNPLLYFDYKSLSEHQQNQQNNIIKYLYRLAQEEPFSGKTY